MFTSFTSGLWIVAVVWEVIRLGGGPSQVSVVATANAVGLILLAVPGGVVADRISQKTILLCVAAVQASGLTLVSVLAALDVNAIVVLAVVSLGMGASMAFYFPAYSAWLPALVPAEDLQAVNGFEGMTRQAIGQAAGPAAAGAVIAMVNPAAAIALAALTSLVGLLALTRVPRTPVRRDLSDKTDGSAASAIGTAARDVKEGFAYMVRTPWLLATLLFASVMALMLMGPLEVLLPFLIKDQLDGGPGDHAMVLSAFGVGSAAGSLLMASLRTPRRYLTVVNVLWGTAMIPLAAMVFTTAVWQTMIAAFILGVLFASPMVIWGTVLQRRVPPHLLGRVSSLDFFVTNSFMPVSMALAGPASQLIGLRATFLIAGTVPLLVAIIAILAARLPADEIAHPLTSDRDITT
ncbi:putative MFS family arabinose efflux permease [Tamaricihabitans halophyticus]|uniref:Putative MFS family arabinose efflux permease n=1 Tax=Tamaricihabitans halophyticus TaxID=1262583 RepID=A0A4R2RCT3_9PSEU|nr:putative MFS family arabinose efflux permease [Tamaricihabitans halophyticus]